MKVICASKIKDNDYYVVFEPPYAGASLMDATIEMFDIDFELFDIPMFETSEKAWEYAYGKLFLYE